MDDPHFSNRIEGIRTFISNMASIFEFSPPNHKGGFQKLPEYSSISKLIETTRKEIKIKLRFANFSRQTKKEQTLVTLLWRHFEKKIATATKKKKTTKSNQMYSLPISQ